MPARSLLIRLLLSFAMILNGTIAAAGVMPRMAAVGDASPAESSITGAAHCDDMVMTQAIADSDIGSPEDALASQNTADPNDHTSPDCCKSGMCECACVHAAATVQILQPPFLTIATAAVVAFVDRGVASTHAPRLDRPPIV